MKFIIHNWTGYPPPAAPLTARLTTNGWNDYSFKTLYSLAVFDAKGKEHSIGMVKIGEVGMEANYERPNMSESFEELDTRFFSLGQSDSYYKALQELGSELAETILGALQDIAFSKEQYERAVVESVTQRSLLRDITPFTAQGQFRRLARGGERLSQYRFAYQLPKLGRGAPPTLLSFEVLPESNPPTNIHVLIGRNGVGKTHLLQNMTRALVEELAKPNEVGQFTLQNDVADTSGLFANVVSVTFSAFDQFEPLPERRGGSGGTSYAYIGLKSPAKSKEKSSTTKSPRALGAEFARGLRNCNGNAKAVRLRRALQTLEADPVFKGADITALIEQTYAAEEQSTNEQATSTTINTTGTGASAWFGRLSSGHKIVLLTMVRLVDTVEERTLVLLDEPEAHLHPPLLSAFVRALSDLLVDRNGVALVATHSPVVLQEVPKNCVWKLRRNGTIFQAERPEMETFGENVGVLTREVFGLEVTQAGFHQLLREAVQNHRTYASVVEAFSGQLGMEARAIVRALTT